MEDISEEYIEKNISPFYERQPQRVTFKKTLYSKIETETCPLEKIEKLNVSDVNRYKQKELADKIKDFIK